MTPEIIGTMIPIVAIVMGISIGMLGMYLRYQRRKEMFALHHQERMAAIEKGIELPPLPEAFFAEDSRWSRHRSPHAHLLVGLILSFVGIIVTIGLYRQGDVDYIFGMTPGVIGLAFLIFYFTVGKKQAEAIEAAEKAKAPQAGRTNIL